MWGVAHHEHLGIKSGSVRDGGAIIRAMVDWRTEMTLYQTATAAYSGSTITLAPTLPVSPGDASRCVFRVVSGGFDGEHHR